MKTTRGCFVAWLLLMAVIAGEDEGPEAAGEPVKGSGVWTRVSFPETVVESRGGRPAMDVVVINRHHDLGGILVGLTVRDLSAPLVAELPRPFAGMAVRLRRPDAALVPMDVPGQEQPRAYQSSGRAGISHRWEYAFLFRAGGAPLGDAVIKVELSDATYWFQLPYGLVGAPDDAGKPSQASSVSPPVSRRDPQSPSESGRRNTVVPWRTVDYWVNCDGRWRAAVVISNPGDTSCVLRVHPPGDGARGLRAEVDLFAPRTGVSFADADGTVRTGRLHALSVVDGVACREDSFRFARYPKSGRTWGVLTVRLGEASGTVRVPSSLFGWRHGQSGLPVGQGATPSGNAP